MIVNVKCYCTKKSLTSLDDKVYRTPLPNITSTLCSVCLGTPYEPLNNITECLDWFFEIFWSSEFTYDHLKGYLDLIDYFRFEKWKQWSQDNPNYALQIPYENVGKLNNLSLYAYKYYKYERLKEIVPNNPELYQAVIKHMS